ncbi:response regulator [Desulfosarcina sp.]|uniref:response regulator n=1 Tax=Desulfosarcina sp. TaxID=2027861 RepID=UPI00356B3393
MFQLPINILIVDDERDFVEVLSLRLTDAGHRVRAAYSGKEALSVLAETEPEGLPDVDVVVLDIKMPGMDGIETLKLIKAKYPVVEVILLTGHGAVDTAVKGLKSGAFDYLLKPADFDELTGKLEAARKQRDAQVARIREAEARALMRRSGGLFKSD